MTKPPMVSYAQNGEDVVLRRAFEDRQNSGFYVDVGACHPEEDSVTQHFYERGWRGINVEPDPDLFKLFVEARGDDMNVNAAIGSERGRAEFFPIGIRGHGTLDAESAAQRRADEQAIRVPVMTLADLFDMYGPEDGRIDFLKVDVEGWESKVLEGVDWSRHRPKVVVVEAVDPKGVPTHAGWEPGLLAGGYRFALFDGLNRFYCRDEDADWLLPVLASPASVLDHWICKSEAVAQTAVAEHAANYVRLRQIADQAEARSEAVAQAAVAEHAANYVRLRQVADHAEARSVALGLDAEEARASARRRETELAGAKAGLATLAAHLDELKIELGRSRDAAAQAFQREEANEAALAEMEMKVQIAAEMSRVSDADLQRAIAAIHAEEIDSETHADRAAQAHASLINHLARHAAEVADLQWEHARLVQWCQAVRTSTSWRVTRPFRAVAKLLRGFARVD